MSDNSDNERDPDSDIEEDEDGAENAHLDHVEMEDSDEDGEQEHGAEGHGKKSRCVSQLQSLRYLIARRRKSKVQSGISSYSILNFDVFFNLLCLFILFSITTTRSGQYTR